MKWIIVRILIILHVFPAFAVEGEIFKVGEAIQDPSRTGLSDVERRTEARELKNKYDETEKIDKRIFQYRLDLRNPEKSIEEKAKIREQIAIDEAVLANVQPQLNQAKEILDKPAVQELFKESEKKLTTELQLPAEKPKMDQQEVAGPTAVLGISEKEKPIFKSPSIFTRLLITINEAWAQLHELFGNQQKVIAIRNGLNELYREYGVEGERYKAGNNLKISKLLNDAQSKIKKHIDVLQNYQSYGQGQAKREVEAALNDILQVSKQLSAKEVPDELRKQLDIEIEKTITLFELPSQARIQLEMEAGIALVPEQKITTADLDERIKKMQNEFQNRDAIQLLNSPLFNSYIELVRQFELGINNLPTTEEQQRALLTASIAYQLPAIETWNRLIKNGTLSARDQVDLLNQFLLFNKKFRELRKNFMDQFRVLIEKEGREPTQQELQNFNKYSPNQLAQSTEAINNYVNTIINALQKPDNPEKIWNDFIKQIYSMEQEMARANPQTMSMQGYAVTPESLQIRAAILNAAYGRLLDAIDIVALKNQQYQTQYAYLLNNIYNQIDRVSQELANDAAALVNIKPDQTLELLQAAPPPPPPPLPGQTIKIKPNENQIKQENYLKNNPVQPTENRQALLHQIVNFKQQQLKQAERQPEKKQKDELQSILSKAIDARAVQLQAAEQEAAQMQSEQSEWD